jgi:hypothetical protein
MPKTITPTVFFMRAEYDFSQSVKNSYLKKLKNSVTNPQPKEKIETSLGSDDDSLQSI